MKIPIRVDDKELLYETFINPNSHDMIVALEDRTYTLRRAEPDVFYLMVRVGGHQRSLRGDATAMLQMVARLHCIYRDYDNRVRRLKEEAQRQRDRRLNELAESVS